MHIQPIAGSVGGLVSELPSDFTRLDAADADAIRAGFDEYALLLFRGRELSLDEQFAICELMGTLVDQASNGTTTFNISNKGTSSSGPLCFHSDFTNAPPEALLMGASLYGLVLPEEPTETVYAHSGRALAEMPEELRSRISGRTAVHCNFGKFTPETPARHQPEVAVEPRAEHPIEFTHPRTGEQFMMLGDMDTEYIVGLDSDESLKLLDELNDWIQQPQFVYRHQWQLHDLVVWDNLVMQHSRGELSHMGERTLRRVPFTYRAWFESCQRFFGGAEQRRSHTKAPQM